MDTSIHTPPDMTTRYQQIPGGTAGTEATLAAMATMAREAARHQRVITLARRCIAEAGVAAKDYVGEARALFQCVKENVRYTLDPVELEHVQNPSTCLFVTGMGDCDDMAASIAALALAAGHQAAFRAVEANPGRPGEYSHVYALIGVQKAGRLEWYAADATQAESYLGWEPSPVWGQLDWPVR